MRLRSFFTIFYVVIWTYLLAGVQTTLWPHFFSFSPAPLLWVNFVIYLSMEKELVKGFFLVYLIGLCVLSFTAMPLGMMLSSIALVYAACSFLRHRIFWPGPLYFAFLCLAGNTIYQFGFYILSLIFESNSTSILFFDRVTQILLNTLLSFVFFQVFKSIDRLIGISHNDIDGVQA